MRRRTSVLARQVLSNEEMRAKYDAQGKEGLGDHDFVDTGAFFAALFGAHPPWLGSPRLGSMTRWFDSCGVHHGRE